VTGLQWPQLDVTRQLSWLHPDQANVRKAIALPLHAEAVALLRKQVRKHQRHVRRQLRLPAR